VDLLFRALDILEFVYLNVNATAEEISEALGIPKSTVYRLLSTLRERDYVRPTLGNSFEAGARLLMLQGSAERQSRLLQIARPHLQNLTKKTSQTTHLAVLSSDRLGLIETIMGRTGLSIFPSFDSPLYCTALGKVLLANLNESLRDEIIANLKLEKRTSNTITKLDELLKELEKVRKEDHAVDNEEFEVGVFCIAVPIRNAAVNVIASISLSGLAAKYSKEVFADYLSAVSATARAISRDLGYDPTILDLIGSNSETG
jgi:IclR family transcriptional regulator, KDG regulon repressor